MTGPKKQTDGQWLVDERPYGRDGQRIRKKFPSKAAANYFYQHIMKLASDGKPWSPKKEKTDNRTLRQLVTRWFELHGHTLAEGTKRQQKMHRACLEMGEPLAINFSASMFTEYRKKRMDSGTSGSMVNHEHAYFRAVFNELARNNDWEGINPLANVRKVKTSETERTYLTSSEITRLLAELGNSVNTSVCIVSEIGLATGCRWGEAETLRGEQIHAGMINFTDTKNGKNRSVPISESLEKRIFEGRPRTGRLFTGCEAAFKNALTNAAINLPRGQKTRILRHTFASHFMMHDGNILALQKILGHGTINQTMVYAHLAPGHLQDAKTKNPLEYPAL